MATSGEDKETKTETTLDVAGFIKAFSSGGDPGDEESTGSRVGEVSMFCKACLHPYYGEQKAGTIVLRCERCGQTDTILEERVGSLNPEEWIGNLMMNRFMQAVKEQEDLSANLVDPDVIQDDYRRLSHAMRDYTKNMEKIAELLFEVGKRAKIVPENAVLDFTGGNGTHTILNLDVFQAMNAIKALVEVHRILVTGNTHGHGNDSVKSNTANGVVEEHSMGNSDGGVEDSEEVQTGVKHLTNTVTNQENIVEGESLEEKVDGSEGAGNKSEECIAERGNGDSTETQGEPNGNIGESEVQDYLDKVGPTVLRLIESLIAHYGLPEDILDNIVKKLQSRAEAGATDGGEPTERSELTKNDMDNEAPTTRTSVDQTNGSSPSTDQLKDKQAEDSDDDCIEEDDDGNDKVFNLTSKQIKDEIDKNLKHKLALRFDVAPVPNAQGDKTQATDNKKNHEVKNGDSEKETNNSERSSGILTKNNEVEKETKTSKDELEDRKQKETKTTEKQRKLSDDLRETEDGVLINFYTLSAEFVRELQKLRGDALSERKLKALERVHTKIDELKMEMSRVGKAVTQELKNAYKTKMEKVENQQKHLDEKKKLLKEAERLMHYYAATGQEEKLADLMAQINMHTSNKS